MWRIFDVKLEKFWKIEIKWRQLIKPKSSNACPWEMLAESVGYYLAATAIVIRGIWTPRQFWKAVNLYCIYKVTLCINLDIYVNVFFIKIAVSSVSRHKWKVFHWPWYMFSYDVWSFGYVFFEKGDFCK